MESLFNAEKIGKKPLSTLGVCYQKLNSLCEDTVIRFYDVIRDFVFQKIDYYKVLDKMPIWITDAGISPELPCSKDWYEVLKNKAEHPLFGRMIYYNDLCTKLSAIQDRICAVVSFMHGFYGIVPCIAHYEESQYTGAARCGGLRETEAHVLLNSIFVAYASIFDILAKVAIEEHVFDSYDFSKYNKMKSGDSLYNRYEKNINPILKSQGLLFAGPPVIRKIETFRNEFVHNGPWDLRCSIYNTCVDGEPADVIIYSPDMDEFGNFVKSGSRNKFYSQANRINIQLPDIIIEATDIVKNTIEKLMELYQAKTTNQIDQEYTKECEMANLKYNEEIVRTEEQ